MFSNKNVIEVCLFMAFTFVFFQLRVHFELVKGHQLQLDTFTMDEDEPDTQTFGFGDANGRKNKTEDHEVVGLFPGRLKQSSKLFERSNVCNVGGMNDDISYAVIAKIRQGIIENEVQALQIPKAQNKPRILCMVYTYEGAHETNLQAIVDTWATQCDGFLAASNVTNPDLGAVNIEFFGAESYGNMWRKIEAMWKYVHEHYLNDYDYFHICGDDVYVIPDNLRAYLMGKQVQNLLDGHVDQLSINDRAGKWKDLKPRPLLLGFPVHAQLWKHIVSYAAGGSGYTLNQEAVKYFYKAVTDNPWNTTDSREDIFVAQKLKEYGVSCSDTRDRSGAFRYVMDNPIGEYRDPVNHKGDLGKKRHFWKNGEVKSLSGLDAFSNETVAIHLNYKIGTKWLDKLYNYSEEIIYRYHDFFSGRCDKELLSHSPNATKIQWYAYSQRKQHKRKRAITAEKVLDMPPGHMAHRGNM